MTGAATASERLLSRSFVLVVAAAALGFVTIGMLLPAVPLFADDVLSAGGVGIGVAAGAASATALLAQPLAGRLGDRRGRRVLILVGASVTAIAAAGLLLADALATVVALRLLGGVGEALLVVGAATIVTDLAPDHRRGEALSIFSLALYGGIGVGPVITALLLEGDDFAPVWVVAAAASALAATTALTLPETRPAAEPDAPPGRLIARAAIGPGIVLLLALFGFGGFNAFVALYARDLGLDRVGLVFGLFAAVVMTIRSVGRRLPDVLGPRRCAQLSLILLALGATVIGALDSLPALFLGTAIFASGQALAYPAMLSLALARAPAGERSSVVGTCTAFVDVAIAFGAFVLGAVTELGGYRAVFLVSALVALSGLAALARVAPRAAPFPDSGSPSGRAAA